MKKYVVLDLEWNQSRHPRETVRSPLYLSGEIIQIGAVRLNRRFRIEKELRLSVVPQYYKKVHRKVSQITGLDNEDLKKGIPFAEAYRKLMKFCGKDYAFLTWGPDDLPMLRDNMVLHGIDPSSLADAFDLQVIFSHQIAKVEHRQFALSQAIEMLGEAAFEAHDALNDAHSTALICRHLNMEEGLAEYPMLAGDITSHALEVKELTVVYPDKLAAIRELSETPFLSPNGTDYLTPNGLVPQNSSKYLSLAAGDDGEEYLVRFRFFKTKTGRVHVTRELYRMDAALEKFYEDKKIRQQNKKPRRRKKKKAVAAVPS